jgi:predicted transcriptional regulator
MKKKPTVGRPPISKKIKKSAKVFINLTEEQKVKLAKLAKKEDRSLSYLCLQALKKCDYI